MKLKYLCNKSKKIVIMTVLIIIFVIFPIIELFQFKRIHFFEATDAGISHLYSASIIVLTSFLLYIAWSQLSGIIKITKADFLIRIDDRYGGKSIIKARQIIQRLYRESNNIYPGAPESVHRSYIAIRINEISEDINTSEDYTYLLNLLDFLETISYFTNKGDIEESDIENLMGPSMEFFFSIFIPRIEARRRKYSNDGYYAEFEKLVKKMNRRKNN